MDATIWVIAALAWCVLIWLYLFLRRRQRSRTNIGPR